MAAALALLGAARPSVGGGRRIAVLGDMLELGAGDHHIALVDPIAAAKTDLVFVAGNEMKALWDALPEEQRGAYAENSSMLAVELLKALAPGDTVLVKGSFGSNMVLIVDALKARGG
jgi:UDP-N-acetylmuramoyl-tripeptide--D-alanyl-D-alanine ligase